MSEDSLALKFLCRSCRIAAEVDWKPAASGMDLPAEPEARERVELLGQTQGALQRLNRIAFRHQLAVRLHYLIATQACHSTQHSICGVLATCVLIWYISVFI